jgi:competence protein ComFB
MDIKNAVHNVIEDFVFAQVDELLDGLKEEQPDLCVCQQCRLDTICYVLNRVPPRYLVSNRGVARVESATIEGQQNKADITALIYEGIRRVNHNQRPNFIHGQGKGTEVNNRNIPVFNIPTIVGRLFNGINFSPMSGLAVKLYRNGDLVDMKDHNWQNPYYLVPNTTGTFTFWPNAITADSEGIRKVFEYAVEIEAPGFETLHHVFNIPVISEFQNASSFSLGRTFKLPDLFMFPPGGDEED